MNRRKFFACAGAMTAAATLPVATAGGYSGVKCKGQVKKVTVTFSIGLDVQGDRVFYTVFDRGRPLGPPRAVPLKGQSMGKTLDECAIALASVHGSGKWNL